MLRRFDDYPIRQMPVPVAQTGTADRNHYDRYFFNGHLPEGEVFFGGAMWLYPNRHVIDAAFSIIHEGRQKNIHVSGRAPHECAHTAVGPITVEVVEPMKKIRLIVEGADHGVEADVTFDARSVAHRRSSHLWAPLDFADLRETECTIDWEPGTRRAKSAATTLHPFSGAPHEITFDVLYTFRMSGISYSHPEWGHGTWKGALAVGGDEWKLADIDPLAPHNLHIHNMCRVTPHPNGVTGILDPYTP